MKTKHPTNARRSLRNATNGTKTDSPKTVKPADQPKSPAKAKSKVAKASPKPSEKAVSPAAKRKREEEKVEDPIEDPVSQETEEVNKPSSNADQDESTAEATVKPKPKRLRKKKEIKNTEEPKWRPLDLDEVKAPDESKRKVGAPKGGDRRKQSLVERDIPSVVMVQSALRSSSQKDDDSDCEVLDGTNSGNRPKNTLRKSGSMDVDNDDVPSEAGSNFCEIIEEGSSSLDFKKLHALARRVHLPSTLWACHIDPMSQFVSFSRFNPDFSDSGGNLVDRAVVFKGSMIPIVFCKGETTTLPEEINSFETLTDVAHALQHLNATVVP